MRYHNAFHIAVVFGLATASAVFAQSSGVPGSTQIQTASGPVTVNSHEGAIDPAAYTIDFDAADSNHNGSLSRAEVKAYGNGNLVREFKVVDANHDGWLSKDELKDWIK